MKKILVCMFLLVLGLCLIGCEKIGNSETYELTIQNQTEYELIGIKNEYKADEEVEIKMIYADDVCTFAFLDGELLGELTGIDSIKFNMPAKDSVLTISYSEEIYKLNVIDNFGLIEEDLNGYYAPEEIPKITFKYYYFVDEDSNMIDPNKDFISITYTIDDINIAKSFYKK